MGLSLFSMRVLWAVALTLPFLQCIKAVSLLVPLPEAELTVGIAFQVDWKWDILPTGNDGVLDINLVKDVASTSVAVRLVPGADAGSAGISATIPLGTSPGQYYLQLNVTSGPEKSSVGGPYTIIASTSSTGNSNLSSTSSNSSSPTSTGSTTGNISPNGSTQSNNASALSQSSQPSLAGGAVAGIVVGSIVALLSILWAFVLWHRKKRLQGATSVRLSKPLPSFRARPPLHSSPSGYNHYNLDRLHHNTSGYHGGSIGALPLAQDDYPKSVANQTIPSSDTGSQYLENAGSASSETNLQPSSNIPSTVGHQQQPSLNPQGTEHVSVADSTPGSQVSSPIRTVRFSSPHTDDTMLRQPPHAHAHSSPHA